MKVGLSQATQSEQKEKTVGLASITLTVLFQ